MLRRVPCPLVEFAGGSCASLTVRIVSGLLLDVSERAPGVARLAWPGVVVRVLIAVFLYSCEMSKHMQRVI